MVLSEETLGLHNFPQSYHKTLDFFFILQNFMHLLHIYVNINDRCDRYHEMRMLYGKEKYNQLMLIDKETKRSVLN